MADKEKRLRKILEKMGWKGKLKSVATLEDAHIVLIVDRQCCKKVQLIGKDTYLKMIERGYTFPEEDVYYSVSTNPRDMERIEKKYLSNRFSTTKYTPK